MWPLLKTFSWQEIAHHPWRTAVAVLAVMLGVALAFAVHLINASALGEFSRATREVDGKPDLVLRAVQSTFDDRVLDLLAAGASNKLIARHLGLSFHTVKAHVATILKRLNFRSRTEAAVKFAVFIERRRGTLAFQEKAAAWPIWKDESAS